MSITIRARVSRTIQEKQYHPFNVELEASEEFEPAYEIASEKIAVAARGMADALTEQVDALISERQAQLANRR